MSYFDLDYPSRETALAIIAALADPQSRNWDDIAALVGLPEGDAYRVAENAYRVYGYRELEGTNLARWTCEWSMLPRKTGARTPHPQDLPAPDQSHGLGRR